MQVGKGRSDFYTLLVATLLYWMLFELAIWWPHTYLKVVIGQKCDAESCLWYLKEAGRS